MRLWKSLGARPLGFPRLGDTLESELGQDFLGLDGVANSWLAVSIPSPHGPRSLQMRLKALTTSSYGAFIHPTLSTLHLLTEMRSGLISPSTFLFSNSDTPHIPPELFS